jgi:uncharacterized protein (TIGR03000 family)
MHATILVRLPADASLTVDDHPTTSTSALRLFKTPPLERGKEFHYTLKAKFVRGAQTITVEEVVPVRAGRETVVSLGASGASGWSYLEGPTGFGNAGPQGTTVYGALSASYYGYSTFTPNSPATDFSSRRVLLFSEQDPMYGAGPPGFNGPFSIGTGR